MATMNIPDDVPNVIMAQIPINTNNRNKCVFCKSDGLYITIIHNKPTDSIVSELRCSRCNKLQENILISEIAHIYSAYLATKNAHDQLAATIYGHQITIANINNMCIVYRQHIDKTAIDHAKFIEKVNLENTELKSKIINQGNELSDKNKQCTSALETVALFESQISEFKSHISTLETVNLENTELKSKIINLSNDLLYKNTQCISILETVALFESQISEFKSYISTLETKNKELEIKHKTLNRELETKYKTLNRELETKYKTLETKHKELETKNKILETKYKTLETKYKTLETEHNTFETKNKILETKYKTLETKYKTLETKTLETKSCTPDLEIEKYTKIVKTYELELHELRNQLSKSEIRFNEYREGQKEKYLSVVNEYSRRYELVKQKANKDYFAFELLTTNKYKILLEEQGVDIAYKQIISEKYRAKLSLLAFAQKNKEFCNIQSYTLNDCDIKIQDPSDIVDLN